MAKTKRGDDVLRPRRRRSRRHGWTSRIHLVTLHPWSRIPCYTCIYDSTHMYFMCVFMYHCRQGQISGLRSFRCDFSNVPKWLQVCSQKAVNVCKQSHHSIGGLPETSTSQMVPPGSVSHQVLGHLVTGKNKMKPVTQRSQKARWKERRDFGHLEDETTLRVLDLHVMKLSSFSSKAEHKETLSIVMADRKAQIDLHLLPLETGDGDFEKRSWLTASCALTGFRMLQVEFQRETSHSRRFKTDWTISVIRQDLCDSGCNSSPSENLLG